MKKILSFLLFFFVAIISFSQSPIKVADYRKSTLPNNGVYTVTGRTNGRIWGDGVYTDDSDLATVCVHVGILRAGETGIIQVTKKPGRSSYPSVSRNGVKSISYGAWDGSYSVALYNSNTSTSNTTTNKQSQSTTSQRNASVNAPQGPTNLKEYRNSTLPNNGVFTVTGRTNGRIWGDGVYTDDSDLATVCVHAGILRAGETGIIKVTKKPGRSSYPSVSRNGVKSISYGAWDGSYSVALYNSNTSTSNTTTNKQSQSTTSQRNASVNAPQGPTNLKEYRKSTLPNNGVYTVTGRTNGRIWGDGVYTDDSDLATVCVHAGILRAGETGVIQVTKKPGRSSYPSVTRNGVKSISYGAWDGSYSVALYNSK